jgi:hypothetical protein
MHLFMGYDNGSDAQIDSYVRMLCKVFGGACTGITTILIANEFAKEKQQFIDTSGI